MGKNEKFHQHEQDVSAEINEEALGDVSGGQSINEYYAKVCKCCWTENAIGWRSIGNGIVVKYCTACGQNWR